MGPQPIIKVQVREDVIPPTMVCSRLVLPRLANPVEGILGDLQTSLQHFYQEETKRGYLECRWVMSPSRRQGILFIAESSNVPEKPTHG